MPVADDYWVKCRLSKGGFPSERFFQIEAPTGGYYTGLAPEHYCFRADGTSLIEELPLGVVVDGWVAAHGVREYPDDTVLISVPDGEICIVSRTLLKTPDPRLSRVPVQS